jgi:uncharacterized protein
MPNTYTRGQKVDLIILRETQLGFVAQINGADEGLLYHNEVFEHLEIQQALPGYIKDVRPDGRIDLLLFALGHLASDELGERILGLLKENNGFLPLNDKSPAEEVYKHFGISKKKYKMAIGGLYKRRLIKITEKGMELVVNKQ